MVQKGAMDMAVTYREIAETDDRKVRKRFTSGEPVIDRYFRQFALENHQRRLNTTHIATSEGEIVGFVTTVVGSLKLPDELYERAKLPRYPMPVLLIAQLGVHVENRGQGIGSALVAFAVERAERLRETHGCMAVTTDPLNESAVRFYASLGFRALPLVADPAVHRRPSMYIALAELANVDRIVPP